MNTIIVDDELHAREIIKTIINDHFEEFQFMGEAGNVSEAIPLIDDAKPELIFLDINLPDGNSFEILKRIKHKHYKVIFITAYEEFAIQAIKFSAFDYILKPVNPEELVRSVSRVLSEKMDPERFEMKLNTFFSNINSSMPAQKKIVVNTSDKIHIIDIKNIMRFESDNSYCTIHINSGKTILVSKSIKSYEELLNPVGFIRVHQSHLINSNYINYFDKQDGGTLVMTDNAHIPVSQKKRPVLAAYLDSL